MKENVQKALDAVDMAYGDVIDIANSVTQEYLKDIDELLKEAYDRVEMLTNDSIRMLIMKLTLKSYSFSEVKEKSQLKATLAETLRKEAYAKSFNAAEGSVAVRDNMSILQTSEQIVVEAIYDLIADLFKTKLSEIHNVISALTTVLTTRLSEAKLINVATV